MRVSHGHYDHSDADRDMNCVFALDRLKELKDQGSIGHVSEKHLTFAGYQKALARQFYEDTPPAIADILESEGVDAVVLTAG